MSSAPITPPEGILQFTLPATPFYCTVDTAKGKLRINNGNIVVAVFNMKFIQGSNDITANIKQNHELLKELAIVSFNILSKTYDLNNLANSSKIEISENAGNVQVTDTPTVPPSAAPPPAPRVLNDPSLTETYRRVSNTALRTLYNPDSIRREEEEKKKAEAEDKSKLSTAGSAAAASSVGAPASSSSASASSAAAPAAAAAVGAAPASGSAPAAATNPPIVSPQDNRKKRLEDLKTQLLVYDNQDYKNTRKVLEKLLYSPHLNPLSVRYGPFGFQEKSLADRLQETHNDDLRAVIQEILSGPKDKRIVSNLKESDEAIIEGAILSHLKRTQSQIPFDRNDANKKQIQFFAKGDGNKIKELLASNPPAPIKLDKNKMEELFIMDEARPSALDKTKEQDRVGHPTNLGAVITVNNGSSRLTATRSGRLDDKYKGDPTRMQELVLFGMLASWNTTEQVGFIPLPDGSYEYQHADLSFLDNHFYKDIGSERERKMLYAMMDAISNFPEREFELPDPNNEGQFIKVIMKKPIFNTYPLNTCAQSQQGTEEARKMNWCSNQELFSRFFKREDLPPELIKEFDKIEQEERLYLDFKKHEMLRNGKRTNFKELEESGFFGLLRDKHTALMKKQLEFIKTKIDESTDPEDLKDYIALYAILSGKLPEQQPNHTDHVVHPLDMVLYYQRLYKKQNITISPKCKSGSDRTGLAIAGVAAADRFEELYGRPFMPLDYGHLGYNLSEQRYKEDLENFRKIYHECLIELSISIPVWSKAKIGIAWQTYFIGLKIWTNKIGYKYLPKQLFEEEQEFSIKKPYSQKLKNKKALMGHYQEKSLAVKAQFKVKEESDKLLLDDIIYILKDKFGIELNHNLSLKNSLTTISPLQRTNLAQFRKSAHHALETFVQTGDLSEGSFDKFFEPYRGGQIQHPDLKNRYNHDQIVKFCTDNSVPLDIQDAALSNLMLNFYRLKTPTLLLALFGHMKKEKIDGSKALGKELFKQLQSFHQMVLNEIYFTERLIGVLDEVDHLIRHRQDVEKQIPISPFTPISEQLAGPSAADGALG